MSRAQEPGSLSGLSILVTGGAGFIGRNLARNLVAEGAIVTALDVADDDNAALWIPNLLDSGVRFVRGSIEDSDLVGDLLAENRLVFHLATPAIGLESLQSGPSAHAIGLEQNLKFARWLTADHTVVFSSTSDVYGLHSKHYADKPMSEDDLCIYENPSVTRWAYAHMKALSEGVIAATPARSAAVRIFNCYGADLDYPRPRRILSRFVAAALNGEPLVVNGTGAQRRAYCHVSDMIAGLKLCASFASLQRGGDHLTVNLGNPQADYSVLEVAELVSDVGLSAGYTSQPSQILLADKMWAVDFDDTWSRRPDISRAARLFGFSPKVGLERGLGEMFDFIASRLDGGDSRYAHH